ncbi:MAG: hypothetical protein HLX50_12090 [Alteromonadaceae bacterium]|nr:hypothetical protein [Alteromonadaceae bacterium]
MIVDEARRQFYLAAAGVRVWYARQPLPGAAPSADFHFSDETGETLAAEPIADVDQSPPPPIAPAPGNRGRDKGAIADLQSLMSDERSSRVRAQPQSSEKNTDQKQSAEPEVPIEQAEISEMVPRVHLQTWVGKHYLLMGVLSAQSSLALQQTLADNILKSVGEYTPRPSEVLRWPLFNNAAVPLNQPAHLQSLLENWIPKHDHLAVIVVGEAGPWLDSALARPADVQLGASLASLAGDPGRKRELWQRLKQLRAHSS